jgi:hypothetical protein
MGSQRLCHVGDYDAVGLPPSSYCDGYAAFAFGHSEGYIMETEHEPLVDHLGRIMFYCRHCKAPITRSDILDFGARLPDYGEPADDYLDSQLLDGIEHTRCITAAKAG